MNTTRREKLADYDKQIAGLLIDANNQAIKAMIDLLKPYKENGVELNYHSEGCFRPMCEIDPNQFSVINSLRYHDNMLQMQIDSDNEWIPLSMVCDLHFLWNELVETLDFYYKNEEEDFVFYFREFKEIWNEYGSFNELLGCAKSGINDMVLALDVDDYNFNDISCYVKYKDNLGIEFTYLHKQDKPFEVTKVTFNDRHIPYESYKSLL